MQRHDNYFTFQAENTYDLGLQLGAHFKEAVQSKVNSIVRNDAWALQLKRSLEYLSVTKEYFPHYVQEIAGYARGADVDFLECWTQSLEDEFSLYREDHCTSIVTNDGKLISHNEDWANDAAHDICVLQKTIGNLTILELNYIYTLGGNSASINSSGYIHLINTLTHSDWQIGVPRNVIARFMSETQDPIQDFKRFTSLKRATGYNHNIINMGGKLWNIESTAREQIMVELASPFVHTNHYLSEQLKLLEAETTASTFRRYEVASDNVSPHMSEQELMNLVSDTSQGPDLSIFNERTIARMIVDVEQRRAKIWLRREAAKGWVEYPLEFMEKV
ncbi:MAG TPA: C45 family peptidase [Ktedonobacterales bacterium]